MTLKEEIKEWIKEGKDPLNNHATCERMMKAYLHMMVVEKEIKKTEGGWEVIE